LATPAHQSPTGVVLSAARRTTLVGWARADHLVIEDDYDAEYRYDRPPVGAMHGLAPDQIIYAGTASKTLAPGLRLGWLVVPERLVDEITAAKVISDRGSPVLEQLTFADFLSRGEFDRHLRALRPVYRRRRDALLQALADNLPELRPTGVSAGFHLVTWLPSGLDEAAVVDAAATRGLGVYGIAAYRIAPGEPGLLFGYAGLNEATIAEGIAILREVVRSLKP
jgi:GntR family transcriptional regulator/MocR family aminotransferase